jgi:hypothetical protein
MRKSTPLIAGLLLALSTGGVIAQEEEPVQVNQDQPGEYTVQQGDSLWSIAQKFLKEPWRWPEVWQENPQIGNPHQIYPGDVVKLTYEDGRPILSVEGGNSSSEVHLSPRIRSANLQRAIPAIPLDAIQQFLGRPFVVGVNDVDQAPYIVAFADGHIIGGTGHRIYVRGLPDEQMETFDVVRAGKPYYDGDTGEVLGYEAIHVADARMERGGDPATLQLTGARSQVNKGDRLLPAVDQRAVQAFHPKPPNVPIDGNIIDVMGGVSSIGQYDTVVIDRGEDDGLVVGNVLGIHRAGEVVRDPLAAKPQATVKLPNEKAGVAMVFRTFPRISFALIMNAQLALKVGDHVQSPQP